VGGCIGLRGIVTPIGMAVSGEGRVPEAGGDGFGLKPGEEVDGPPVADVGEGFEVRMLAGRFARADGRWVRVRREIWPP